MRVAVGIVLAALVAASPAVGNVFNDFAKVWAERDAQYTAKKPGIDQQATVAHEQLIAAAKAGAPDLHAQIIADTDAEHARGELSGRGVMLQEAREKMQRKPSAAMTAAWLQGKLDELQTSKRELDNRGAQLVQATADPKLGALDRLRIIEQYASDTGYLQGQGEELVLLKENLTTLYQAKAESDQRRRAAWAAFGAAMQRMGQQQQRHNWSATCMGLGPNMMTCNGQ
jgi:hypothetical protein